MKSRLLEALICIYHTGSYSLIKTHTFPRSRRLENVFLFLQHFQSTNIIIVCSLGAEKSRVSEKLRNMEDASTSLA